MMLDREEIDLEKFEMAKYSSAKGMKDALIYARKSGKEPKKTFEQGAYITPRKESGLKWRGLPHYVEKAFTEEQEYPLEYGKIRRTHDILVGICLRGQYSVYPGSSSEYVLWDPKKACK